jgi:hypothetical protein
LRFLQIVFFKNKNKSKINKSQITNFLLDG